MNELQIFENTEFGEIRVGEHEGQPWFVAKDVLKALGYPTRRKTSPFRGRI